MDWREIPGNLAAFERLVELVGSGEAIAFVGAGASAPLYPLWRGLLEGLIDTTVAAGRAEPRHAEHWRSEGMSKPIEVALAIRKRLDDGRFFGFLTETFKPREPRFTATHAALAQLPFAAYVTTNYDNGLALARQAGGAVAEPFHWQHDNVRRWLQHGLDGVPILHAHGFYSDSTSLVLDRDRYSEVYAHSPFLQLMERLWTGGRLVTVGFSFSDPWLDLTVGQMLDRAGTRRVIEPGHVAILGLDVEKRDNADLHRESLEAVYHENVLFYTVEHGDHSGLQRILADLAASLPKRTVPPPRPAPPTSADLLAAWFEHVIAEHERFPKFLDRPGRLDLIEHAWVEVQMQPDVAALERAALAGAAARSLEGSTARKTWHGQALTLEAAVALGPADADWITGSWLIEGLPGSGKTTLLRHFAHGLAQARDVGRIPVFVALPRIVDSGKSWLSVAIDGFSSFGAEQIISVLERAGSEGRLLLLLDGLDEVPPDRRKVVDRLLRNLRASLPECPVVVSTRPLGRGELPEGFPRLELLPLPLARQREFLEQWFREAGEDLPTARATAQDALSCCHADRHLRELVGNPLYLTLLALLWQQGERPPERLALLYDRIFELLLSGQHRPEGEPIPAQEDVREALGHLAYGMTVADRWAESPAQLERRLRERALDEVRHRLETVSVWKDNLQRFLKDVAEQTQILGPHDTEKRDWRFWHRTFREALTAERLRALHGEGDAEALAAWAGSLTDEGTASGGEGRWAEPLAILAGRLEEPDVLVRRLAEVNPRLALRSMAFTQGLKAETLLHTLELTEDLEARARVFQEMPDQLDDPRACLALVEQLKESRPGGFDLYWLGWMLGQVAERWPGYAKPSREARHQLFDHIPAPADPELFRSVESGLDGRVPLWRTIPAGIGWIGSPEGVDQDRERPRHQIEIVRPFAVAAVPVTHAQYAAFDPMKAKLEEPQHPVVRVRWYEAVSFCRWLAARVPGCETARLPTEEEWEYACRAGSETAYWSGDKEADLERVGWYDKNSESRTHAVGEKPANPWGLYDVHGNVWEWTASVWDSEKYQKRSPKEPFRVDPAEAPADLAVPPGDGRVMRGGGYWVDALIARSACRYWDDPVDGLSGFRVLLSSAPGDG